MTENKKTIQVSEELYEAIQQLKNIFSQLTGQQIDSDEDVIGILVSGFIQSLEQGASMWQGWWANTGQGGSGIITE